MRIRQMIFIGMLAGLIIAATSAPSQAAGKVSFESHDLTLVLDVPAHTAAFTDKGTANFTAGWNFFELSAAAQIESFMIAGEPVEFQKVGLNEVGTLPLEAFDGTEDVDSSEAAQLVVFEYPKEGESSFELNYAAEFFQDVSNIRFSNENVGGEVRATISDPGAYLGGEAFFYPQGGEELCAYRLTADIPASWESISAGNRLASDSSEGRKVQTWQNPYPSDGLNFFAAPFVVGKVMADSVEVYCYFFAEDAELMEGYLSASADYIRMYAELIGPYPLKRFTVVENFFPTGYGMPGWTLLGQQVLRLPFIKATSLGHEVLHNWWGNSVFVDYERGNWCEGLTVYGADYRYKLLRSLEEARDYRKNILKQYVSYINEGNDFSLREFKSRTNPGTRTVGYNKSMMLFHMLENLIGTDAFFAAWKDVYDQYKGRKVGWEEWIAAFEKTSGENLSFVIPEWIDRAGAPVLAAEIVEEATVMDGDVRIVKLSLADNSGLNYRLNVPIRISGDGYTMETAVTLEKPEEEYTITISDSSETIEIDPDYSLFRRLYPEEVEPVISAILGNPHKMFIHQDSRIEPDHALREFGLNMTGDSVEITIFGSQPAEPDAYAVILDFGRLPEYLQGMISMGGDSITVGGVTYDRASHTFVLSGQDWEGFDKYLFIITQDFRSLPRIGQLIPHYGKYSYLVFEGPKNVGKGQWEVDKSPLKIPLAVKPGN